MELMSAHAYSLKYATIYVAQNIETAIAQTQCVCTVQMLADTGRKWNVNLQFGNKAIDWMNEWNRNEWMSERANEYRLYFLLSHTTIHIFVDHISSSNRSVWTSAPVPARFIRALSCSADFVEKHSTHSHINSNIIIFFREYYWIVFSRFSIPSHVSYFI